MDAWQCGCGEWQPAVISYHSPCGWTKKGGKVYKWDSDLRVHREAGEMMSDLPIAQASIREKGAKLDTGKPRWSLLPAGTISMVIAVLEFGAARYGVDNWQHVPDSRRRYYDAAMRHINAWLDDPIDEDSGQHHLAHAVACLLYLMWFDKNEVK